MKKNKSNNKSKTNKFEILNIQLLLTILLMIIFSSGIVITLNIHFFKTSDLVVNTMINNHDYTYNVNKLSDDNTKRLTLNEDDLKKIKENTNSILNNIYTINTNFIFGSIQGKNELYPSISNLEFIEVKDDRLFEKLIGNIPNDSNEIVVHKYFVDYCMKYGIKKLDDTLFFPKNYEEIINFKTKLGNNQVTISGIIDDDNTLFKQAKFKNSIEDEQLKNYIFSNYIKKGNQILTKGLVNSITDLKKLIGVKIYDDDKDNLNKVFEKMIYINNTSEITKNEQYIYSSDNNYTALKNIADIYYKYSKYVLISLIILTLFIFLVLYSFVIKILSNLQNENKLKIYKYLTLLIVINIVITIAIWFIIDWFINKKLLLKYHYIIKIIPFNPLILTILVGIILFVSLFVYVITKKNINFNKKNTH